MASDDVMGGVAVVSGRKIRINRSPELWSCEERISTIDKVYRMSRPNLVEWTSGWLDDLETICNLTFLAWTITPWTECISGSML